MAVMEKGQITAFLISREQVMRMIETPGLCQRVLDFPFNKASQLRFKRWVFEFAKVSLTKSNSNALPR